jgi:hypothetical protein
VNRAAPVGVALSKAALWRLLGLLLERPRPGFLEEARTLARELDEGPWCAVPAARSRHAR